MFRKQKKPEDTKTRNGVPNFIKFMRDFHTNELPFPVQENYLKEYITFKVNEGKLQTKYLRLYITNIKAHNEALGFSWTFGAIKDLIKLGVSSLRNSSGVNLQDAPTENTNFNAQNVQANVTQNNNLNSSNLDISHQGSNSFNASCNSQGGQSYDQNSTGFNFQDIPTDNAYFIQENVTRNDSFLSPHDGCSPLSPGTNDPNIIHLHNNMDVQDSDSHNALCNSQSGQSYNRNSSGINVPNNEVQANITQDENIPSFCDARLFFPPRIRAPNVVPLPTDINSYIDTQPNNNFQTDNVQTGVTQNDTFPCNMSYHDARPFTPPEINSPNNIGTQHTRIMPNNNPNFPDALLSPQPEINANLQNILSNQLLNPLGKQILITSAWKQFADVQTQIYDAYTQIYDSQKQVYDSQKQINDAEKQISDKQRIGNDLLNLIIRLSR
ncbi:hypothetical protein F8M41_000887 [Gigaspora margarita]|uniref:Uncharacterized protein n=1 Tax=Gigaspora margarita TaxID=4874 RepID=A0A8H3XFC1_GIGMA|nr:hypothetical protein F8M41_000887 [Gigaspora margarita]